MDQRALNRAKKIKVNFCFQMLSSIVDGLEFDKNEKYILNQNVITITVFSGSRLWICTTEFHRCSGSRTK